MPVDFTIQDKLEKARKELLDTSTRNRLIHTPLDRPRAKSMRIVGEQSQKLFQRLVCDNKAMSFLSGKEETTADNDQENETGLPQPHEEPVEAADDLVRHSDAQLQTTLASEALQKRLLSIYYDARTYQEEQGVNILYLALGFLEWYESPSSDKPRTAPLILVPVELQRPNVGSRFKLRALEEEITTNLSIQAKLKAEFGVKLPDLPGAEDIVPEAYFDLVATSIQDQPRWRVLRNDIMLGFFPLQSF